MDNINLKLHDKFITEMSEVVETYSDNLCSVIKGISFSIDAQLDELPNLNADRYTLQASLCKGEDDSWNIAVNAFWGNFGRMPLAYLTTKHSYDYSEYRFEKEIDTLLEIFETYPSEKIQSIVKEVVEHIKNHKSI